MRIVHRKLVRQHAGYADRSLQSSPVWSSDRNGIMMNNVAAGGLGEATGSERLQPRPWIHHGHCQV